MKAIFRKVLKFFGVDVLLLGLFERLAARLVKKLTALQNAARQALEKTENECDG